MGQTVKKLRKEQMKTQKRATTSDSPDIDASSEDTPSPGVPDAATTVKEKTGLVKKAKKVGDANEAPAATHVTHSHGKLALGYILAHRHTLTSTRKPNQHAFIVRKESAQFWG